jgi:TolA-binding protein
VSEKIDLGKNPFGSFADEDERPLDEVAPDVLSDLMQVGGGKPTPIGADEAAALAFDSKPRPVSDSKAPGLDFDKPADAEPKVELPWPDLGAADPFAKSSPKNLFAVEPEGFSDTKTDDPASPPPPASPQPLQDVAGAAPLRAEPPPPVAAQPVPTITAAPRAAPQPEPTAEPAAASASSSTATASVTELPVRPPEPIDQRKLWLLRILLVSNLAMMLVMLLMPHPMETRTEYVKDSDRKTNSSPDMRALPQGQPMTGGNASRARPDAFVQPPRELSLGLPNDPLYEKALVQALDGDFVAASATLREFLDAHPGLDPSLQRLVHAHLAYYLRKAGAIPESIEHETKSRELAGRSFLPEELLRNAREAELRGDGDGMRRAYAQFLLQEEQLPPALQALVQEAYLKLGDAYRIEAERGESAERSARQLQGAGK